MALFRTIRLLLFPRRASTQTWMMLTFALFVGLAVLIVGMYSFLVLRGQVHEAAHTTLRDQTYYLAAQLESVERDQLLDALREITGVMPVRVGVATADSLIWEMEDGRIITDPTFMDKEEVRRAVTERFVYIEREENGRPVLYGAVYRPESGLLVRVGQIAPPMYTVLQRILATLIIGMVLALVLALIGAWIAAQQVTKPLQALSSGAQRIAEGDLDHHIEVQTRAIEIQDLKNSLNAMSGRFLNDISELHRMAQIQNEFIGNVSHEVKNPIFAVGGYLEALESAELTPEMRIKYANKGLMNLQRLNNLFSDLIEIAKLEYRPDALYSEPFDLQELLLEVCDMLEPKAQAKDLQLSYDNPPVVVNGDRSRIRQVLINLIDNAIAYSDSGTVRCRIRRRLEKARVEIVDTGRGIPEESLNRVFERFYRADPARARAGGGAGLGLAIVKQLVELQHGQVSIESEVGRGTSVRFTLPLTPDSG